MTPSGNKVLMPAVAQFISKIDTDDAVYVTPIDGFFDDESF